jgi:hypothetical protein
MRARFSLCALCLVTGIANAGVYIETVDRDSKTGKSEPAERWYVQDGKARIEGPDGVSIFKDGIVYGVDPSRKSYHVMDKATMDQLTARMKQAREQRTQAQLAKLPPEKRAEVQEMMSKQASATPRKPVVEAKDAGKTETINGRSCQVWDITRDSVLDEQYCVAAFAALPGGDEVQALMQKYQGFFEQMSELAGPGEAGDSMREQFALWQKLNGYPLAARGYSGGTIDPSETIVKAWQSQSVPASMFEIPADYTKRDLLKDLAGAGQ